MPPSKHAKGCTLVKLAAETRLFASERGYFGHEKSVTLAVAVQAAFVQRSAVQRSLNLLAAVRKLLLR